MTLTVLDIEKLRICAAITEKYTDWQTPAHCFVRLNPNGTAVATDGVALAVAEYTVMPFEGEPLYVNFSKKILKTATSGSLEIEDMGGELVTDKRDGNTLLLARYDKNAITHKEGEPLLRSYPDYQEFVRHAKRRRGSQAHSKFRFSVKRIHEIASAFSDWPTKLADFEFEFCGEHAVWVKTPVAGLTLLFALMETRED